MMVLLLFVHKCSPFLLPVGDSFFILMLQKIKLKGFNSFFVCKVYTEFLTTWSIIC